METTTAIEVTARCIEAAGVIAIVAGGAIAIVLGALRLRSHNGAEVYRAFRHDLGRAIIVGLELLVAADIVQTIGERPSLDGRWPWQRAQGVEARPQLEHASNVP